ncbi:MAG: hypothetical protein JWN30_319 [Bacilli bacterium]|nr:hypothetical protein [Bacilli bacterium]
MIKQNVGTWDAYVRIMGGLMALGYGIQRGVRRNDGASTLLMAAGAMKVAEGLTRVCPLMHAMGIKSLEEPLETTHCHPDKRR